MASRARKYEEGYRRRSGVTELAERMAGDLRVEAGPFAGMRLRGPLAAVDAAPAKLLGSYELEIGHVFAAAAADRVTTFVDVGCADGYYAVGMAFASPTTHTYAFDIAKSAQRVCRALAEQNGVADRVHIGARCDADALRRLPLDGSLVLVDIEGAEVDFLDAEVVAYCRRATIVVEVHEDVVPNAEEVLTARFESTHVVERVAQAPREPTSTGRLASLTGEEVALALSEHRDSRQGWVVFRPRA